MNLFTCGRFQTGVFGAVHRFLLLLLYQRLWNGLLPSDWADIYKTHLSWWGKTSNILSLSCFQFWICLILLHVSSVHPACGSYLSVAFSNLKLAALAVQYKSLSGKLCDIWHFPPWVLHGLQWLVRLLNYSCRYPTSDSAHKSWSTVCAAFTVWQTSTSWPVSDKVSVGWTWTLIKQVDMAGLRIERENWMAEELWCSIYIFFITSTWLHLNGHLEQSWTRSQPLISSGYKVDGKPSVKLSVACWVFHRSFSCVFWKDKGNMRCW